MPDLRIPHNFSKQELIDAFVVHHDVFERLYTSIKTAKMRRAEQHYLIEGQRGSGKTSLLLRLSYEIERDKDLSERLIPIVLQVGVYEPVRNLYELWEMVADKLSDYQGFNVVSKQIKQLDRQMLNYERRLFDLLVDSLKSNHKKLVLFIDNMVEMLRNFTEDKDHQRLREVLMRCAEIRVFGASSVIMDESYDYGHSYYEFFAKESLRALTRKEAEDLLTKLGERRQQSKRIKQFITEHSGRLEALRILTGGVPRTFNLLFDIIVSPEQPSQTIDYMEVILDEVDATYRNRLNAFDIRTRKLIDALAKQWDAASPMELADIARMDQSLLEDELKHLKLSLVERKTSDVDNHYYYLSERFFNLWYLMRILHRREEVKWLLGFMESYYQPLSLQDYQLHWGIQSWTYERLRMFFNIETYSPVVWQQQTEMLIFLLRKKHYDILFELFENQNLNIKARFKPVYFAYLKLTKHRNYAKITPEIYDTCWLIVNTLEM